MGEAKHPSGQRNLLAFRLERQIYALPIEPVVQIIPMLTIVPLPQISDVVEGVINVRGRVVPVVDMRRHLDLPPKTLQLHTPIILAWVGEWTVGLIVDEVMDVLELGLDRIVRPADILPAELSEAPVLQGLAHTSHGMILLLDPGHLFSPHQQQALAQAASLLPEFLIAEGTAEPAVEARPEAVVEESSSDQSLAEAQPKPARRGRKKRPHTQEASKEPGPQQADSDGLGPEGTV